MNKALPLLQQYVGRSLVSVTADGVTQPWPVREALACERLELVFDHGPVLTLAAAGEDHFYGEADLLVAASGGAAPLVPPAGPERNPHEQGKYWQYEPQGLNLWPSKYLMHVEFRWETGSFSAGYLVARSGQPLTIDLNAVHLTAAWLDGTATGLEHGGV